MLSTENDPSCSQLKNTGVDDDDDDRPSNELPLLLPEVDPTVLLRDLDTDTQHSKFSIRNYVRTSRDNDIKTNWPFSSKALQLCLDHGVKELLPPFQTSGELQDQSFKACASISSSYPTESTSNIDTAPFNSKNSPLLDPCNNSAPLSQQPEDCSTVKASCRCEGENEFPSTVTNVSQSEIKSVRTNSQSYPPLETSLELEGDGSAPLRKSESTARPLGKKRKLTVKFGTCTERSSGEYIASNSSSVSEMMASKVCPVCKTFSSSSNTTLNAHIDQCLTVESTPNWTVASNLNKHKIKPRKFRHISDIYATAKHCTLEELDRRNGRNFGTVPELPTENADSSEIPGKAKAPRISSLSPEETGDVGSVYIDDTGTKIRILSKSTNASSVSKPEEGSLPRNPMRGVQRSKIIATKKKQHPLNRQKYLNQAMQSKNVHSHKVRLSQICGVDRLSVESSDKIENQIKNQVKSGYSRALKQWAGSKRTRQTRKEKGKVYCQPLEANQFGSQKKVVNNTGSAGGNQSQAPISAKNLLRDESNRKTGTSLCGDKKSVSLNQTFLRESVARAIRSRINEHVETSLPRMTEKSNRLTKCGTSIHVNHVPSSMGSDDASSDNFIGLDTSSSDDSDSDYGANKRFSGISRESMVDSSLKRNSLSAGRSTEAAYETKLTRNLHGGSRELYEYSDGTDSDEETFHALEEDIDTQGSSKFSMTDNARAFTQNVYRNFKMLSDNQPNDQPFCEAEHLRSPLDSRSINEHEKVGVYGVNEALVRQSSSLVDDLESELGEGNDFPEVDPIPIPGPPGSFLPSPGETNLEEFRGKSLSSTEIISSPDEANFNVEDSSDSLISATTTLSNSMAYMSDRCSEPYTGLPKVGNDTKSAPSGAPFKNSDEFRAGNPQTSAAVERTNFYENLNGSKLFGRKGSLNFESQDNQRCGLQSMGTIGQFVSYNSEEPQPLKHPTLDSSTMSGMGRQIDLGQKTKPWISGLSMDEKFSLRRCASKGSLDVSIPTINSIGGPVSKDSPGALQTPLAHTNHDSVSPSSNPTLRLMGKNLMVVNKDEDLPVSPSLHRPNPIFSNCSPQVPPFTCTPPSSIHNQNSSSSRTPPIDMRGDPENSMRPCSRMSFGKSMNFQPGLKAQQTFPMLTTEFLNHREEASSHIGQYFINTGPNLSNYQSAAAPLHNVGRVAAVHESQNRSVVRTPNCTKEFIFIDADKSKGLESHIAYNSGDTRGHHTFSHGVLHSALATNVASSRLNSLPGALSMVQEANVNVRRPIGQVGVVVARTCTPDGLGVLNQTRPFAWDDRRR